MNQNDANSRTAAADSPQAPPDECSPPTLQSPEAEYAEEMLAGAALPETISPESLPPEAQLQPVLAPESPSLVGSASRQGYIRRVVGGTFHYGLGQSLPQIIRFCLLPIFARLLLPTEYGYIDLTNNLTQFLITPMRMGVPGAVTRFYYDYPEGPSLKDYVTTVAWFLLVCSIIVALTALAIGPWLLGRWIPGLPFVPFAILGILSGLLYCNLELQNRLVQAREQSSYAAKLNIGRASISILLAVLFVIGLRWKAMGMLIAEVTSYGVLGIVAAFYLKPELKGRFRMSMLRSSLTYGMAMLPGDFVGSLVPLVMRGILAVVKSVAATGVLAMATKFAQPLTILGTAFTTAYNPIYFSTRKEGARDGLHRLAATARNVWAMAIFFALGVALLGPLAIVIILPANYHPSAALLPILVFGFLGTIINSVFATEIYYSKQTWWVPICVYGSAAVGLAISALSVRALGAAGVAWGTVAQSLTSGIMLAIVSLHYVKIPHHWFSLLRVTVCGAIAGAAIFWMPNHGRIVQCEIGLLGILLYPALLFVTGDSSIREGYRLACKILERRATGSD